MKNWHLPVEVVVGRGTVCEGHRWARLAVVMEMCEAVFSVSVCHSVQLDVVFCDHLALLADKITHKQMWNSFYAQIVPLICTSITLKQIHIFKISFLAELAVVYFILELSLFSFLSFHRYWFLNLYLLSPYQIDFSYRVPPGEKAAWDFNFAGI